MYILISFCLRHEQIKYRHCPGMGMGYGSSLPMSGYYHQMGPMSQVKKNWFQKEVSKTFFLQMTGQSSLYSGMSSMGAWGMAGTMAGTGGIVGGTAGAHSAFGIGSGTASSGQAQLPIGTSMVGFFNFLRNSSWFHLLQNFWPGALASEALSSGSLQEVALQGAALQGALLQSQTQSQLLHQCQESQEDHPLPAGSSGLLQQSQTSPPSPPSTALSRQDEWPSAWSSSSSLILSESMTIIMTFCHWSERGKCMWSVIFILIVFLDPDPPRYIFGHKLSKLLLQAVAAVSGWTESLHSHRFTGVTKWRGRVIVCLLHTRQTFQYFSSSSQCLFSSIIKINHTTKSFSPLGLLNLNNASWFEPPLTRPMFLISNVKSYFAQNLSMCFSLPL